MKRSTARKLAVAAVVVAAAIGILTIRSATASTPRTPPPGPPDNTGSDSGSVSSEIQPQPTQNYWTPERMRNARPAPMPRDND